MTDDTHAGPSRPKPTGRPVSKYGKKARARLFKYKTVDYEHRMNAIHQVAESTRKKVYGWIKHKDHILRLATTARTSNQKCVRAVGTGTTLPAEEEAQLARWVHDMRKDGIPVTYNMLHLMALETAIDVGLTEDEFKAGRHWIHGFKRRHGLSFRAKTRIGQDTNKDGTSILAAFSERVLLSAVANGIDVIYNADQTGDNTVWVKCGGKTKDRATVMLLADTTGKKHPLFLGFGKRVWKEVKPLQARQGCRIYANPTAWWNSELSLAFLKYHFAEREGRDTKK
ncbi:hypothetical protein H310_13160, partial [Aphanomyces invadans]